MPLEFVTVIQSLVSPFLRLMAAVTTSAGTVEVELESELVSELVESESTYPAKLYQCYFSFLFLFLLNYLHHLLPF